MDFDFDTALQYTLALVEQKSGKELSDIEQAILRVAWEDMPYESLVEETGCKLANIRTTIGSRLWMSLTACLEESVGKKSYRRVIEKRLRAQAALVINSNNPFALVQKAVPLPKIRGCHLPDISLFIGRKPELAMLREAIQDSQCVTIIGAPGIGKSALSAMLINDHLKTDNNCDFDGCIWKSGYYPHELKDLLYELLNYCGKSIQNTEATPQALVSQLIFELRQQRLLLVLDGIQDIAKDHDLEYGLFLRRLVEESHQSCVIVTTQIPFSDLDYLHSRAYPIRFLRLEGLGSDAIRLLERKGLRDTKYFSELVERYRGNPLMLNMVSNRINEYFNGRVKHFLNSSSTLLPTPIDHVLSSLVLVLSAFELEILFHIAKHLEKAESIDLTELQKTLNCDSTSLLIESMEKLYNLSLVERKQNNDVLAVGLQPVILKFVQTHQNFISDIPQALQPSAE